MFAQLLIYLLISIGCSCLWSLSDVFIPARNFVAKRIPNPIKKMLLCIECSSFWIGLGVALFLNPFDPYIVLGRADWISLAFSAISGGVMTHLAVRLLSRHEILV